jgi:hypothetical protein
MKDIGEILKKAVTLQINQVKLQEQKEEQDKINRIRSEINYTCGFMKRVK